MKILVVGSVADNPFVEDIAQYLGQKINYLDLISLKIYLNTEFCPRFIVDEESVDNIGNKLRGYTVLLVSTDSSNFSRNELAMRNLLIARGAKDNGADKVILLEPDLFYSAQDRGPRKEHGKTVFERDQGDYKKFDGQPFSARMYAELLKQSGVDSVITVHTQSVSVDDCFNEIFDGNYYNLSPAELYAEYLLLSDVVNEHEMVFCSPDKGASEFVQEVRKQCDLPDSPVLSMSKTRFGERDVAINVSPSSEISLDDIRGKDVLVLDDMVRTGLTITETCRKLQEGNPRKIVFLVTHFYSSREGRINMNDPSIDEIVTTTTIPIILNRDVQGRLRHKIAVLRIAKWISSHIRRIFVDGNELESPLFSEDLSSKNPRWKSGRHYYQKGDSRTGQSVKS